MRKFNFLFGALLLASASLFTSCFSNDIPSIVINGSAGGGDNGKEVKIEKVTQSNNYTYTIMCNAAADIRVGKNFDNLQKVASTLSYTGKGGIGERICIRVTPNVPGYVTDTIKKEITLDTNGKVIYLTFAKNPSEQTTADPNRKYAIPLNEALEKTADGSHIFIENTPANKKEPYPTRTTDVKMEITHQMTENALANGASGESLYSITAKEAVMTGVKCNLDPVEEWFPVLSVMCKPDGANFVKASTDPATVIVTNKDFESDMSFCCDGSSSFSVAPEGGSVTMKFNHFSDYTIKSFVKIERDEANDDIVETKTLLEAKVGNLTYNYFVYSGCKRDGLYMDNEFINKYLEAKYGKFRYEGKGEITVENTSQRATVSYTVTQKVYGYKATFGSLVIRFQVYGPEEIVVDVDKAVVYDPTKHSGGAAW